MIKHSDRNYFCFAEIIQSPIPSFLRENIRYLAKSSLYIFSNNSKFCLLQVAKASFQRNNDALDAALFYLAMKKKAVVWGLFR